MYAICWQAVLSGLVIILFLGNGSWLVTPDFWGWVFWGLNFLSWILLWRITLPSSLVRRTRPLLMTHNIVLLLLLFTAVLPQIRHQLGWPILIAFGLPLLSADWFTERDWPALSSAKQHVGQEEVGQP